MSYPNNVHRNRTIFMWLAFAVLCAGVIWARFTMTVDLAYFLPAPSTEQEHVLLDRLGQGPGSQLIFVTVIGQNRLDTLAKSARLTEALSGSPLFSNVLNGQEELTRESIPDIVWNNRYLLTDIEPGVTGLAEALRDRLTDLAIFAGADFSDLVAADPHLAALTVVEGLSWSSLDSMPKWLSADGRTAYLVAEVTAPAFDVAGQAEAIEFIRASSALVDAMPVTLHGFGVYGVELQQTIRSEAQFRSMLATLAIIAVLLVAYRRIRITLLAVVPLALGALGGIAGVALLFGQVHGITLAFGFTLFGVAVDYPLHFFSHCRNCHPRDAIRVIWPTLRLGAISTIIAYLSMSVSGSQGLAQLGILSSIGILVAMFATRSLLPTLMAQDSNAPTPSTGQTNATIQPRLRHAVWLIVLAASAAIINGQDSIWSNDLSTMTPIEPAKLQQDTALRASLGAPNIRYLVALRATTEQQALEATETLATHLAGAQSDGLIDGFQVATTLLPSRRSQLERRARLANAPNPTAMMQQAVEGTPFRAASFAPYISTIEATINQPPLTAADFEESVLAGYIDAHLYFDGNQWVSLTTLFGLSDPAQLATQLAENYPDATLVDLKSASQDLVRNYRQRIHWVLSGALLLILVVLINRVGFSARLVWIVGTLSASLLGTIAINALLMPQLSIFSLIALVLVAGLGLDYALFISRAEEDGEQARQTNHALIVCVTSTLLAFLILAFSSVPILASLGTTVTVGVFLNYALARAGASAD